MNGQNLEAPLPVHAGVRAAVATIDREMSRLPKSAAGGTDELVASWAKLVELLALGPAPELRECPVCKHTGMRAATLCGYCWTKLSPLGAGQ
jgi:hypothetical protein